MFNKLKRKYNKWLAYKHPFHRRIFEILPLYNSSLFWFYMSWKDKTERIRVEE